MRSRQRVDNYEYELPADFEDEEIDEDAAFNDEDKKLYAEHFPVDEDGAGGGGGADLLESGDEEPAGLDRDDLSPSEVLRWAGVPSGALCRGLHERLPVPVRRLTARLLGPNGGLEAPAKLDSCAKQQGHRCSTPLRVGRAPASCATGDVLALHRGGYTCGTA
jgi:hypothetical protein